MGIQPEQIQIIWQGILFWMKEKKISPSQLVNLTNSSLYSIEKGIEGNFEWPTSDFIHSCVDAFGLRNARNRSNEETADILSDEE